MSWLRGFALIALLVFIPFALEARFDNHFPIHSDFKLPWKGFFAYGVPIIVGSALLAIIGFVWLDHELRTVKVSKLLTLAERDLNDLLRAWGGGLSPSARRDIARERAGWLSMVHPLSIKRDEFFDLNERDLEGKGQSAAATKARFTAFLLREVYDGHIEAARSSIITKIRNDPTPPYVGPGLRDLVGMDEFERTGVFSIPRFSGHRIKWTVRLYGYPRDIEMVKTDPGGNRYPIKNWEVINELTRQQA